MVIDLHLIRKIVVSKVRLCVRLAELTRKVNKVKILSVVLSRFLVVYTIGP